jgi:hypothetical protein
MNAMSEKQWDDLEAMLSAGDRAAAIAKYGIEAVEQADEPWEAPMMSTYAEEG